MDKDSELIAKALKNRPYTLAVDMDGTLAVQGEWKGYGSIGAPIMSVIKDLRRAKRKGTYIVIHSCRVTTLDNKINPDSLDVMRKWLKDNDVPYDEIWTATGKPYADIYLDDKAANPGCPHCMREIHGAKKKRV